MPVPTHFRITVRGRFEGTPEVWSYGVKYSRAVGIGNDTPLSNVDESTLADAISAFMNSVWIQPNVITDDYRVYQIGTDGKMEGNGPLIHTFDPNSVHGSGTRWKFPPQVALAVTTVSDNRGPAKLGRFYLPGPSVDLASGDGRVSAAQAQNVITDVVAMLKGISDGIDLPNTTASSAMVNVSPRGGSQGTLQDVDHIELGRVLDTIRTRRNAMLEQREVGGQIDW